MICTSRKPNQSVICPVNVIVGQVRPRMSIAALEQARKALDLRVDILLPALDDHLARDVTGDHIGAVIARDAEHANGVIMREQDVADRLVRDAAHLRNEIAGHLRRRARIDHQHGIIADTTPEFGSPSAVSA